MRFNTRESVGGFQNVEHLHRRGHGSNLSGKGEAEEYFFKGLHHIGPADDAGNRKSIPHRLAKTCQIRDNTEHLLRASQAKMEAAANLVEDQQRAAFVREILHSLQKASRGL